MKKANQSKVSPPKQTVFEYENELRKQAIEISKKHIDIKPIKYLLK